MLIFMQQSNIFKWFTTPLFILAITSHRYSNQECSFLPKRLLHGESPAGSAPHSTDEWFISHVVNEMVFAGLCLHKTPFMFGDSEPQQISHLFQQIIISAPAPLMWGVMSGPCRQHMKQEEASWQCAPKNVTRSVIHQVACPEFPPSPCWHNQHHTVNTEASWVAAETLRFL